MHVDQRVKWGETICKTDVYIRTVWLPKQSKTSVYFFKSAMLKSE